MRGRKNDRGSVTAEAAVIMPIIMSLLLSLTFLIKIVHTHVIMQHAINDAANEIATYSYLYSAAGLQKIHDNKKNRLNENGSQAEEDLKLVSEGWDAFSEIDGKMDEVSNTIKTMNISELKNKLENIKGSLNSSISTSSEVKELIGSIANDPKQEMISIGSLLEECMLEDGKTKLIEPVIGYFIRKNLETSKQDADASLKGMSVVNGFDGIDLSSSTIFNDKKSIDIIVKYKMKLALPFNILPEIYIVQRSTVRAWLDGDGAKWSAKHENTTDNATDRSGTPEYNGSPGDSWNDENSDKKEKTVWDLPPKVRGKVLQTQQGRNLPDKFPTIAKLDNNTAYSIKSIDITEPTYLKPANLKYKLRGFLKELYEFTDGSYMNTKVSASDYLHKTLVVVVPKDSKNPINSEVFEECKIYAKSLQINLVIIEHPQKKTEG